MLVPHEKGKLLVYGNFHQAVDRFWNEDMKQIYGTMRKTSIILTAILMTMTLITSAQTKTKNPFGLVYEDAISENQSDKVTIHPVIYKLNGINIAANVRAGRTR